MKLNTNFNAVEKKKCWFAPFKYPTPELMEYYLEEMASEGYSLEPVGEKGMFYYEFTDAKAGKCKFMVDKSELPKAMYVETILKSGWELMGQSMNCYIWRQYYENERPQDMTDAVCLKKHSRNMFFGMLLGALILLVAIATLIGGYIILSKHGKAAGKYFYFIEAAILAPICMYFFWASRKFFKSWKKIK